MNILYINNFKSVDYLNDLVFHGGRKIYGEHLVDSTYAFYMYDNLDFNVKHNLYGHGFTVTGNLPIINIDRENIEQKISDHYYDLIIYGSIHRDKSYLDLVLRAYRRNEILVLDGEDDLEVIEHLTNKTRYFKREMVEYNHLYPTIPISFSFPEELLFKEDVQKEQLVARLTTAQNGRIFSRQEDYYHEFNRSYFALTKKKAGWDCMRHYEIVMSGSLPVMKELHELPKLTMTHWDRNLLKEVIDFFWHFRIDNRQDPHYFDIRNRFIEHAKNNLTTTAMFNYVLSKI